MRPEIGFMKWLSQTLEQRALIRSIVGGRLNEFRDLLDAGVQPSPAALIRAVCCAHDWSVVMVLDLLKAGADPNWRRKDGRTALMVAVTGGRYDMVWQLLRAKANPNESDRQGMTALLLACTVREGPLRKDFIVQDLVKAGAHVNARDRYGWTPLMWLAKNRRNNLYGDLLRAGADVNLKSKQGMTALMIAAASDPTGWNLSVEYLLRTADKGTIDVNAQDISGMTALMWAIAVNKGNDLGNIDRLLDAGADPHIKDCTGRTALDMAGDMADHIRRDFEERSKKDQRAGGGRQPKETL